MRRILLCAVLCSLCWTSVYANPPSKITAHFDLKKKKLIAIIDHPVVNVDRHYIEKVEIVVNEDEGETKVINMKEQSSDMRETVIYEMGNVVAGDTIKITAYCSLFGELSKTIVVEE